MKITRALEIHVKGLVQGVGFRPFVYRLAREHHLSGWVMNTNSGVDIHVEGTEKGLNLFVTELNLKKPPVANIHEIKTQEGNVENASYFRIINSANNAGEITRVSPDIAVCDDCLADMKEQEHRIDYPFINCTNCGPRFTIVRDIPYDRKSTTMQPFTMCTRCESEYNDIEDRRFHAQPVACKHCGPHYLLETVDQNIEQNASILNHLSRLIQHDEVVAIKGTGGYHLACNGFSPVAVGKLRKFKRRDAKPFAVMFRNIDALKEYANVSKAEEELLISWRRPIVLLETIKQLASGIHDDLDVIGAMLPYMPFHYLLFNKLETPALVMTSGNISDEPIIISDKTAGDILLPLTHHLLSYNREIHNRTDDSVAMVVRETPRLIRRSRGYVPNPVNLDINVEGIFAVGAELVNCFCIGKDKQAILSQHIGDLKNLQAYHFFEETYQRFTRLFRFNPRLVAADLHPDYLSTGFAEKMDMPLVRVQHHHAHVAAVMAVRGINKKVIGVVMDGTGLGDDGKIWGSEFLVCNRQGYERKAHFQYFPMPGGDKAVFEPWRLAVSILYELFGDELYKLDLPFLRSRFEHAEKITNLLKINFPFPETCGMGRFFDAVAAMTNICSVSGHHAEAPMKLEGKIIKDMKSSYPIDTKGVVIGWKDLFHAIVKDIINERHVAEIATKFHNTIINVIFAKIQDLKKETGINTVILTGGGFQNRYLTTQLEKKLINEGYLLPVAGEIPVNDGGLALGQLIIAANKIH